MPGSAYAEKYTSTRRGSLPMSAPGNGNIVTANRRTTHGRASAGILKPAQRVATRGRSHRGGGVSSRGRDGRRAGQQGHNQAQHLYERGGRPRSSRRGGREDQASYP